MAEDQTTSDLVVELSDKTLERVGILAEEIDLLIVSTDTPELTPRR